MHGPVELERGGCLQMTKWGRTDSSGCRLVWEELKGMCKQLKHSES